MGIGDVWRLAFEDAYDSVKKMRLVRFEKHDGSLMDIDLKNPPENLPPFLAEVVRDLAEQDGKQTIWMIRSAFHKEVRRGDIARAVRWSKWMQAINGVGAPKYYVSKIVFEETRNLALFEKTRKLGPLDPETVVRWMVGSRKKWELEYRRGLFEKYLLAYLRVRGQAAPTKQEFAEVALSSSDPDELMALMWRVWCNDSEEMNEIVSVPFIERGLRIGGAAGRLAAVFDPKDYYCQKTMAELFAGLWVAEEAEEIRTWDGKVDDPVPVFPYLRSYVFDNHVRQGMALYMKRLKEIQPGRPLPPNVDPRWSGLMRGVCWREYAAAQFGDAHVETPWEKVEIPSEVWKAVWLTDQMSYETLYRFVGGWTPWGRTDSSSR